MIRPFQSKPLYISADAKHWVRHPNALKTRTEKSKSRLTNCVLSISGRVKDDETGALGAAVRAHVDVGADDVTGGTEEILELLPASLERQLNIHQIRSEMKNVSKLSAVVQSQRVILTLPT